MDMMKKTASAALCTVMISAALLSCGGTDKPAAAGTAAGTASPGADQETAAAAGLAGSVTPEISKELGLDGYDFKIYLREKSYEWSNWDLDTDELNGEALNDAVYSRNLKLQETFGFNIETLSSGSVNMDDVSTMLLAGDDTYDSIFPQMRCATSLAQKGLLLDLRSLKYLDFASDSWSSMYNDTLSMMNRLFYATGDISLNYRASLFMIIFNKAMLSSYALDDPYGLVRDGKWTLDAIESMSLAAAADIDGDSKMTKSDQWGLVFQESESGVIFYYGSGERVVALDSDNRPFISLGGDRSTAVYDRIVKMMGEKDAIKTMSDADTGTTFRDGRALFLATVVFHLKTMRSTETDFGVLPVPKYDEPQENYIQFADGWCISPACVPVTAKNPETSGFILQAIAEASRDEVIPAYYDICLSEKYARDQESVEMLDIIFKNCLLENSDNFQWAGFDGAFKKAFIKGDPLQSLLEKYRSKLETAIEATVAAFEENT